ncbi:capsid protein [Lentilactobacillus sp. Marseille-Q4993]|uniref:capsid protein n=1 Tax=Lentilactobacillus sp. Marseille-Q4993 TaxID=3039492 RepID=UPI0024BD38CA|nr:capsid protein [Lentilactobacillus sp. Marseille-Q4993]
MPSVVNYAEAYQQAIVDGFYTDYLYTNALWQSPSNASVSFVNAKTVKLPKLTIDEGRKDRQRRTITSPITNYSTDWIPKQLAFDRYWDTLVDPLDVDETNQLVTVGNVTRQFNIQQKLPEDDSYMTSKLYKEKVAANNVKDEGGLYTDALTADNVLEIYDKMMEDMDEARVPATGRLLYVTPAVNTLLKTAAAKNRTIMISTPDAIARTVRSLDEVTIVVVPSDLMDTDYDFTSGAKRKDDAQAIQMFLIQNGAQIAPIKYTFVGLDQPSAQTAGNFLYYEQAYEDVFLLPGRATGYAAVTGAKKAKAAPAKKS